MQMSDSLAEQILKNSGAVSTDRLLELKAEVKTTHVPLAELILHYGILTEEELTRALAETLNLPFVNLAGVELRPVHLRSLPEHLSRRYRVVVFDIEPDNTKLVASDALLPLGSLSVINKALDSNYRLHIATPSNLHHALDLYRQHDLSTHAQPKFNQNVHVPSENPKVLESIHHILEQAIARNANSVHIEPRGDILSVRFRIDGSLREAYKLPVRLAPAINERFKLMAGMSGPMSEGHFKVESHNTIYRVEVLTLPVIDGEKLTLNLHNESARIPNLEELGLWGSNLTTAEHALTLKRGLVILTGPRDEGKTVSLYSMLSSTHLGSLNALTIEDKPSFKLSHVSQIVLGPKLPSYELALKSSLKQNPEILLLDKVLSPFIAEAAADLSLNCLVLAGINAADPFKALLHMEGYGVEPFRLAHASPMVMSTRLVRKLCTECKESVHPTNDALKSLMKTLAVSSIGGVKALHRLEKQAAHEGMNSGTKIELSSSETSISRLWQAKKGGCSHCDYTGYKGRVGLQAVLDLSTTIKAKIAARASQEDLIKLALKEGYIPLSIDGLVKALRGLTSIEEVQKVL